MVATNNLRFEGKDYLENGLYGYKFLWMFGKHSLWLQVYNCVWKTS
jgi:hypothetical protein